MKKRYEVSFAPLEGITGKIFRRIYNENFKGVDYYYTPFITPKEKYGLDKKDLLELDWVGNGGINLIPQVLTNRAESFNLVAERLIFLGYNTINLNLGCPSGTVVAKKKGAGALTPSTLLPLLDGISEFSIKRGFKLSIKTRIGIENRDEFEDILNIYKRFPIYELIIHPRTRREFYRGSVDMKAYLQALKVFDKMDIKLCFNGDLYSLDRISDCEKTVGKLKNIMIGRGFLMNPFLVEEISGTYEKNLNRLRKFLDELFLAYSQESTNKNLPLMKLKEIWQYLAQGLDINQAQIKNIKKAIDEAEYKAAINLVFSNLEI